MANKRDFSYVYFFGFRSKPSLLKFTLKAPMALID